MPSTYPAELVSLEGPDAIAFAQAQFSSNLASLSDGQWQFSAWLDAQGRVRALFHLIRLDSQRLLLLLRGGEGQAVAGELQRYLFRARARIAALPARQLATAEAIPLHVLAERGGTLVLGCGSHGLELAASGDDDWRLLQLRSGWPWLARAASGELLPAWLGLGALGAAALDKGCYPGQEIVARMHYRGGTKRHLHRLWLSRALPSGVVLEATGRAPIQLLDVVAVDSGAEALAVVHDDTWADLASGLDTSCGNQAVFAQAAEDRP
jgi:folate-binding protein YgfZ